MISALLNCNIYLNDWRLNSVLQGNYRFFMCILNFLCRIDARMFIEFGKWLDYLSVYFVQWKFQFSSENKKIAIMYIVQLSSGVYPNNTYQNCLIDQPNCFGLIDRKLLDQLWNVLEHLYRTKISKETKNESLNNIQILKSKTNQIQNGLLCQS